MLARLVLLVLVIIAVSLKVRPGSIATFCCSNAIAIATTCCQDARCHGRATPLIWRRYVPSALAARSEPAQGTNLPRPRGACHDAVMMDKHQLIEQLMQRLAGTAQIALRASEDAANEARDGATPQEKREDARVALEQSRLAKSQGQRAQRALAEIDSLGRFRPLPLGATAAIELGALVEVEDEDSGEGRTFFLAPVGAGVTLTGPGGDGYLSVVTPSSPIGRAVIGRRTGDVVDVTVDGDTRAWAITYVA